ncbi:MAG: hypothetical protein QM809_12665 [Gordonia sp. (in: high G+C Gram-positive bacteria)]|uniref:hypothetical protein n=1 Tax=Gordonia sp. (in: high G+C Gram-positive bacteria) TaxID=84139 RepID=UPI0039E3D14C
MADPDDALPAAFDAPAPAVPSASSAVEVEKARVSRTGARLARALEITGRGLRLLVFTLATLAALLGAVAMLSGALIWQHADHWRFPTGIVLVVLLCLPAVALPYVVHRRLSPLTRAIERPGVLLEQTRDYVGDVRAGTEIKDVISIAAGPDRVWKPRSLWQMTQLVTAFTSRVMPDPKRHPLLAAFTPVYLKTLWLVVLVTAWSLVVAVVVLGGSLLAMLFGWTPTD